LIILAPLIDLKFLWSSCGKLCRNFKSAAPGPTSEVCTRGHVLNASESGKDFGAPAAKPWRENRNGRLWGGIGAILAARFAQIAVPDVTHDPIVTNLRT
jgi:hypothetical protein